MQFLPLVLIFVVFYFLLIRPQTKRAKEHRAMVAALGVGAEVVTSGGILGKIGRGERAVRHPRGRPAASTSKCSGMRCLKSSRRAP